jgi:signal transduction histidine kinase
VKILRRASRPLLGAAIGLAAVLLSVSQAGSGTGALPFTVILVISIALAGLALGADSALAAFVVGTLALIGFVALSPDPTITQDDAFRLIALLVGAPAIVLLVWRGEEATRAASRALDASRGAEERIEAERQRIDSARAAADGALEAAQRDRARLAEVAEAIPEPLVVYDGDLHGTYGNRAALRLFGRSFVERPIEEWGRNAEPRDEQGRPLPRDEWPQIRAQAEPIRARILLRIPMSGRDVIVDVEGTPIPGGGAVLLWRDVGKEEDERRRLSRFASFVAHELRNPLAVAKARIELAQRDPNLPRRAATHGTRALESVDAAIGILERLELYSRADSGRVEASREPFELAHAVGSAIERLRARGSEREVLVSLAPGVHVIGDAQLSVQAITNLLTNADRYSTPVAPIHVEVEPGDQVILRVRDEGPGVADEVAGRLFRDRVSAGRGLGLGLYLVHATMEAMGGSVSLEQRRPCAIFALRWPAAE